MCQSCTSTLCKANGSILPARSTNHVPFHPHSTLSLLRDRFGLLRSLFLPLRLLAPALPIPYKHTRTCQSVPAGPWRSHPRFPRQFAHRLGQQPRCGRYLRAREVPIAACPSRRSRPSPSGQSSFAMAVVVIRASPANRVSRERRATAISTVDRGSTGWSTALWTASLPRAAQRRASPASSFRTPPSPAASSRSLRSRAYWRRPRVSSGPAPCTVAAASPWRRYCAQ